MAAPRRLLRKVLRYRDQTGRPLSFHAVHWDGFTFMAGPVIVAASGPWGTVQVWASTEAEGRRVVNHAAAAAGFDAVTGPDREVIVTATTNPRYGRVALMRVVTTVDGPAVSKRQGPSGSPELHQTAG